MTSPTPPSALCRANHVWLALFVCPLLALSALAQDIGGTISGRVRNQGTGTFLQGAAVSVEGTNLTMLTQRDGSFTLTPVPAGARTLHVTYTGLDPHSQTVQVAAGETSGVDVALTVSFYTLDTFTVAGQREGNAASITRQRNAENVVNVVSMDTYGNVADGNIGNFLQKLTGLAANKEAGEIVGISIRGTPPGLNAVTLDGTRTAAAIAGFTPQGDRAPLIDQIPSEFIKEIEVTKGNLPEQWADSLGGTVNLVTKSAFDFKDRVITYRAGATLNTYRSSNPWHPSLAGTYLDTFGAEKNFGLALSASYTETTNTRDRVMMEFRTADFRNTRARLLNDISERLRAGIGAKLEFRPTASTQLFVSLTANKFNADMERVNYQATTGATFGVADYSVVSRADIEGGATPRTSTGAVAGVAPGFTDTVSEMLHATWINQVAVEAKRSQQFKIGVGGETTFNNGKLTYAASHNPARYENTFEGFTATQARVGVRVDRSADLERPVFTQTYGRATIGSGSNFNSYTGRLFVEGLDRTEEEVNAGKIDYELKLDDARYPVTLKAGFNYRRQHRTFVIYRPAWDLIGADGVAGTNSITGLNDDNIAQFLSPQPGYGLFNGTYPQRDALDYRRVAAHFKANPGQWRPVGLSVANVFPTNEVTEEVSAAYVQGKVEIGKLLVTGGVRMENTDIAATGRLIDSLLPVGSTQNKDASYSNLFPSVHLRYEPRSNLVFRASWSTSSARPALSDVVPTTIVTYDPLNPALGTVVQNNPGLKPQYSNNYDITVEYYFEPAGVVSAGYFHKDLSDFLFTEASLIGTGANNGFNGRYANFTLIRPTNSGDAKISGYELSYNQQLSQLPKPFNGLSLFANYTKIETSGTYSRGATTLPDFVPETINAGFSFEWRKFELRSAYNFKSSFLSRSPGTVANPSFPIYFTDDKTVDLNLQYKWRPGLTFFVDYINIFNKWPSWYSGTDPRRIEMAEVYGSRLSIGVSGRF